MEQNEKRKEILKQRRQEISEEYKRRREKENKPLVLDTEEVTISIENLQAHLQALSREITIEKLDRKVEEYKAFFTTLSKDKDILFEMIETYKSNKNSLQDLQSTQENPVESIIRDRLQHKEGQSLVQIDTGVDLNSKVCQHTYQRFQQIVEKADLPEADCIELSLRLFIEYCEKNIPIKEKKDSRKSKIFRSF